MDTKASRFFLLCVFLVLPSIHDVGAQSRFILRISPAPVGPLQVMPGESAQFNISAQFNTTTPSQVALDIICNEAGPLSYALSPRLIGKGECAVLTVEVSKTAEPGEFALFIRGSMDGEQSLVGVVFKVLGQVMAPTTTTPHTSPTTVSLPTTLAPAMASVAAVAVLVAALTVIMAIAAQRRGEALAQSLLQKAAYGVPRMCVICNREIESRFCPHCGTKQQSDQC